MNWKSNAGSKVLEERSTNIDPSKKLKFIPTLMNSEVERTVLPHKTIYLQVEFLTPHYEITTQNLEKLQETGESFDFLNDKEEKIYKPTDGDPL